MSMVMNKEPKADDAGLCWGVNRSGILAGMAAWLVLSVGAVQAEDETGAEAATAGTTSETATTNEEAVVAARATAQWNARLRVSFDYRRLDSDKDTDLYGYFYGQARELKDGHLDIYTSARLHTDFDEATSDSLADDPYKSLDDVKSVTEQRLMQLYADVHTKDRALALRGGRQYVEIADYLQMDGAQLMMREESRLGGRLYLGHPVSYYSTTSGDLAGGLSLIGRPWEGNQTRFTYAQYYDDSEDGRDNNYYLDLRQQVTELTRARGQISLLNDDFRMSSLDLFYVSEDGETDLSLGGSYWGSFDAETRVYSPLYNTLGKANPYTYSYARLTQQVVPSFFLSPGASLRFANGSDNAYNNRDYQNYDLTFIYQPSRAFSASLSLEHWAVEESDSFNGITGEVRYRYLRLWEVGGGVSYAEYTYDTYSDLAYSLNGGQTTISESGTVIEESPYVRTYFLRAKWKVTRKLALRVQFDVEDDQSATDLAYRGRGSVEVRY